MKFVSFLLAGVFFFTILLNPFVELFSQFIDKCSIGAALKTSCRTALINSADINSLRDVESKLDIETFKEKFRENFCYSLNLKQKSPVNPDTFVSIDGKYNNFNVYIERIDEDECEIEVTTAYKFKTNLFKRFFRSVAENDPTYIVIKRRQILSVEN